jgi:phage shock protein A
MAIFERLSDLLKANVNDMLDKAEDPEKMVKQIIIDMEAQVNSATQALGAAMGSEKQALKQLESAKAISGSL